jgi:hypothetical protein
MEHNGQPDIHLRGTFEARYLAFLEAEVSGVFYAAPNQGVLRSKISHAVSDRWRVIVGGELLRGESSTLFDLLRHNSSLYTELRWGF